MNGGDLDEESTNLLDPLVPREIDRPTPVPLRGSLDDSVGDIAKIFAAPDDPREWSAWRESLTRWRDDARARIHYSGAGYRDPRTRWTADCLSVALVWLWDERLFDPVRRTFTVDSYLDGQSDIGGIDGVVLWHAYPVIGIDDRNQFDFYRDVAGLDSVILDFQNRGVRVFIDYNPWDVGTRRAPQNDAEELSILVAELGVDGVFLDTLKEGDAVMTAALQSNDPPTVLEGESRIPLQRIEDHQLSWAQWFADSPAPGVLRAHWFERRHMMHHTRRWNRDHSDELQSSWMNGTGILVWDAVFGVWVGWNARDKSTLRRMLAIRRAFSTLFVEGEWSPLCDGHPLAVDASVYASRWQHRGVTLWTLVNRGTLDWSGVALDLRDYADLAGGSMFDLGSGEELTDATATVTVPARSISAILRVTGDSPTPDGLSIVPSQIAVPIDPDSHFPARHAERIVSGRSTGAAPSDAIVIEAGERTLETTFRRRETGRYQGAPYVEEWKPLPPRLHDDASEVHSVVFSRVAVAATEVTALDYGRFLAAERPVSEAPTTDEKPATDVDLEDARAYAAWAGARLPTEFEWQVAAGSSGFRRSAPAIWNLTDSEHSDGVTRFVMLKGGSDFEAKGSDWYFDGGLRDASYSAKYLIAGLGISRSPNIGFRLAWDLD